MIPLAAVAAMGLPVLTDLVGRALGAIDNPVAQAASGALSQVGEAIHHGEITPEQVAEANRHVEAMTRLDNERELGMVEQVNETMREEARSEDAWSRRWRPFFGYIVAATWGIQSLAVGWVMISNPNTAAPIINALGEGMATMWWVALAVLGIAVVKRSEDKAVANGLPPAPGLLGRLLNR